jgi:hypothetical protein
MSILNRGAPKLDVQEENSCVLFPGLVEDREASIEGKRRIAKRLLDTTSALNVVGPLGSRHFSGLP